MISKNGCDHMQSSCMTILSQSASYLSAIPLESTKCLTAITLACHGRYLEGQLYLLHSTVVKSTQI